MTVRYYSGFDLEEHYPNFSIEIDDGTVSPFTVNVSHFTVTKLSHVSMAPVLGAEWSDFAGELQAAINAQASVAGSSLTWSVSYDESLARIVISADGTWSMNPSTEADPILGAEFAVYSSITSRTLERRPEHAIVATIPGRSQVTDDYEPEDVASQAIADSGGTNVQGIARTSAITYQDWRQEFEPKSACFARAATTEEPWTFQAMVQHCRTVHPIYVDDTSMGDALVCRLRQEGSAWSRNVIERAAADYDRHWHVNLHVYMVGRP